MTYNNSEIAEIRGYVEVWQVLKYIVLLKDNISQDLWSDI